MILKIESSMKPMTVAERQPVKEAKTNEQPQVKETVRADVQKTSPVDKVEISSPAKVEGKERVEMSSHEMKTRTEGLKTNQAQDAIVSNQIAEQALSSMKEKGESLKELASKHQEAKPEDKLKIEKEAKAVMVEMKKTAEHATFKGKNVVEEKLDTPLPKDIEKLDMKEFLKPENIEKNLSKPLEEASTKTNKQTENLVASLSATQVAPMTKADANQSMQKVKDALKDADVRKVASGLDTRRANVSHLLQ